MFVINDELGIYVIMQFSRRNHRNSINRLIDQLYIKPFLFAGTPVGIFTDLIYNISRPWSVLLEYNFKVLRRSQRKLGSIPHETIAERTCAEAAGYAEKHE